MSSLPKVEWLLGDQGYDADWFREAAKDKGIRACIPGRKPVRCDKRRYKRRNLPGSDRDHVRQVKGLAARCDPIRWVPEGFPICHRACRSRHLLAMCHDPRVTCSIISGRGQSSNGRYRAAGCYALPSQHRQLRKVLKGLTSAVPRRLDRS